MRILPTAAILAVALLLCACTADRFTTRYDTNGDGQVDPAEMIVGGTTDVCSFSFVARAVAAQEIEKSRRVQGLLALCDEMATPQPLVQAPAK